MIEIIIILTQTLNYFLSINTNFLPLPTLITFIPHHLQHHTHHSIIFNIMIINIITFNNIFVNTTISTSISSLATLLSSLVNLHQESSKTLCSIIFLSTSKASSILLSKMMIIITVIKSHLFNPSSSHKLKHYAALFFI